MKTSNPAHTTRRLKLKPYKLVSIILNQTTLKEQHILNTLLQ